VADQCRRAEARAGHSCEWKSAAGLPSWENEPLPGKPKNFATNETAKRKWKRAAEPVHRRNRKAKKTRAGVDRVLRVVNMVSDVPAIYFPYSLDFRGRVYPISNYLNPQGDDLSKALLKFAEGKPLGDDGIVWLAIHGANCMDTTPQGEKVSKMTLDERLAWVLAHSNAICAVADDPFLHSWWQQAEDPLQFYAFCVEWRNATVERSRTGDGATSALYRARWTARATASSTSARCCATLLVARP
jgi:Mitochondrial DNA-directed RNA polymerase